MGYQSETNIEAILNLHKKIEWTPQNMVDVLETYLNNGAEELTLDQYKRVRQLVDENYRSFVAMGLETGELTKEQVDKVGRIFTDYIRDQHARLLNEQNEKKIVKAVEEKPGFFSRAKSYVKQAASNILYQKNWRKIDNKMYELERLLLKSNENPKLEKQLIDSIPQKGLSKYKIKTLERMVPRTHYKTTLTKIINSYKTESDKRYPSYQQREFA